MAFMSDGRCMYGYEAYDEYLEKTGLDHCIGYHEVR
jgi:hypothetical protein